MKLYRVDDLLASYCEIGGYYIFAENLSDKICRKFCRGTQGGEIMTKWDKEDFKKFIKIFVILFICCLCFFGLNGCAKSYRVNSNIRTDADNFKIRRRVIALNTRTGDALFTVEGYISIKDDDDGDLNVTIKTGKDSYKLFYAHLSDDVTYTSVQLDDAKENPYSYKITFFPTKEFIENGLIDIDTTDE